MKKPIVKKFLGGVVGGVAKKGAKLLSEKASRAAATKRAQARVRAEVARKKRIAKQTANEKKASTSAKNIATNKKNRNTRRRGRIAKTRSEQERVKANEGITNPQKGKVLNQTKLIEGGREAKIPTPILTNRGRLKTKGDPDKVTTTKTEEQARKDTGKTAADLSTPSSVATPGSGKALRSATPANEGGVRSSQVASKTATDFDKALVKKEKALAKYIEKRDSITDRAKKLQFVNESMTTVTALKAAIKDMTKRGGPRVQRKAGGSLKDMPAGNKGLPNLPTATRNKMGFKKAGGMVKKMGGGSMNRKKYMNKGGIVKRGHGGKIGDGNSFVADCYK